MGKVKEMLGKQLQLLAEWAVKANETVSVKFREDIGTFENRHAQLVSQELWAMLKNGSKEFKVPQPTAEEQEVISFHAEMENAIEKYELTQATPEEVSLMPRNIGRAEAIRLAKETDYWERRNVLIYHEDADISISFKKWQALRKTA